MAFPSNPVNNQTATVNGVVYIYDSNRDSWTRVSSVAANQSGGGGGGASGRVSTNTSLVTETYLETAVGSTPANSTNPVKFSTAGVGRALSGSKGGSGQIYIST